MKKKKEKERLVEVERVIKERMLVRSQKKSMVERKKLGKAVKEVFAKDGKGLEDDLFKGLGEEARSVIGDVLENNEKVSVGKRLCHIWKVNGTDTRYDGKIAKISEKTRNIWITYWSIGETEEDGEDFKMKFDDSVADIVGGDLLFI